MLELALIIVVLGVLMALVQPFVDATMYRLALIVIVLAIAVYLFHGLGHWDVPHLR